MTWVFLGGNISRYTWRVLDQQYESNTSLYFEKNINGVCVSVCVSGRLVSIIYLFVFVCTAKKHFSPCVMLRACTHSGKGVLGTSFVCMYSFPASGQLYSSNLITNTHCPELTILLTIIYIHPQTHMLSSWSPKTPTLKPTPGSSTPPWAPSRSTRPCSAMSSSWFRSTTSQRWCLSGSAPTVAPSNTPASDSHSTKM